MDVPEPKEDHLFDRKDGMKNVAYPKSASEERFHGATAI